MANHFSADNTCTRYHSNYNKANSVGTRSTKGMTWIYQS